MTEARKCVNEDEVAEYFISLGFEEVFCENLSMKEKIGLFRGAKRNVLKRFERVKMLQADGKWKDSNSPIGLPKTKPLD